MSADEQRRLSREGWERAAAGWGRSRVLQTRSAAPVASWMVDAIEPQPGHVVLELAAGAGETGFLAAELIHPGGRLITTDGAPAMLDVARERAKELGIENVEFTPMEVEWIDMPTASVDGILCRWGYMLVLDPEAALRETRRVLRPGGRVAMAIWDAPELNPFMTAGPRALEGTPGELTPRENGPFSLAAPGAVQTLLEDTGFVEFEVTTVDMVTEADSLDEMWGLTTDLAAAFSAALKELSPADHTRVRDRYDELLAPYVNVDGSVAIPGRTQVAWASA